LLWLCVLFASANAAATVKGAIAIDPGDVAGPKKPVDQVQFEAYVASCKSELGFESIPQMDCRDENFRPPVADDPDFAETNDWVAHATVNESVDAVFVCRWVQHNTGDSLAAGGEMIVHNRFNGKTCFFRMEEANKTVPLDAGGLAASSPRVATTHPPSPTDNNARAFWDTPKDTAGKRCTGCHAAGPYIASPQIVGALSKYGLINDGHDTYGEVYTAVGAEFGKKFNTLIKQTLQDASSVDSRCANQCHLVGGNDAIYNPEEFSERNITNAILMPAISRVIADVKSQGAMYPDDPSSDYRWINRDSPLANNSGDYEKLSDVRNEFPQFYCKKPKFMQAHVIDDDKVFATDDFVDVINTFNLQDGLICLNADQASGKCANYETRYRCKGRWRDWQSHDTADSTGDLERRSKYVFPSACTSPPTAIQARYFVDGVEHRVYGPPDRLSQFNRKGLVCLNEDQSSGEACHNYAVRFICE
jgi:Mucin-2 protein WxxW repeating region